jgi:phosphoglycolate phosphatase
MIGDRKFDALGAGTNGIPCLGALWGHGSADELNAAGAASLVARPHDLPAAVARLASSLR